MTTESESQCSERALPKGDPRSPGRSAQLRRVILSNTSRMFRLVFIKGDTARMKRSNRRRPERRVMSFAFADEVKQPADDGLMIVFDEDLASYRHINLATCERLVVIGDHGEIISEWLSETERALRADRVRERKSGRFAPRSAEKEPLAKASANTVSADEADSAMDLLFG